MRIYIHNLLAGMDGVIVKNPQLAMAKVLTMFFPNKYKPKGIHPKSIIDLSSDLGNNVTTFKSAVTRRFKINKPLRALSRITAMKKSFSISEKWSEHGCTHSPTSVLLLFVAKLVRRGVKDTFWSKSIHPVLLAQEELGDVVRCS